MLSTIFIHIATPDMHGGLHSRCHTRWESSCSSAKQWESFETSAKARGRPGWEQGGYPLKRFQAATGRVLRTREGR